MTPAPMNEADTRANLVEPKLKAARWTDRHVTREYYSCERSGVYVAVPVAGFSRWSKKPQSTLIAAFATWASEKEIPD